MKHTSTVIRRPPVEGEDVVGVYHDPGNSAQSYAMTRSPGRPIATRSLCLFLRSSAQVGDGEEKLCHMSMLPEQSFTLRKAGTDIRSFSSTNSDLTFVDGKPRFAIFRARYRCIAYNARGYPPSDVPEDAALYGWEFAVDDIAAVMRGLAIERAHVVGLSMGGYAALQFGLRYPEKASAIVAAGVGSGSPPSQRDAWLKETSVLSRIFIEHGMRAMAERMARGPARIQLKYKDRKTWQEFMDRLRQQSRAGNVKYDGTLPSACGRHCMICAINRRGWRFQYCSPWATKTCPASKPT